MTERLRLVRDVPNGVIHRADCPTLFRLYPDELAPFEGLERTLGEPGWQWCLCLMSVMTGAVARCADRAWIDHRAEQPLAAVELVRTLRRLVDAYERRLRVVGDQLCESRARAMADDDETTAH